MSAMALQRNRVILRQEFANDIPRITSCCASPHLLAGWYANHAVRPQLRKRITKHLFVCDQMKPFRRVGRKLPKLRLETAQRKENVTGLVAPARFWKAGDLRLQDAQVV